MSKNILQDRVASIVFFILSVYVILDSITYSLGNLHNPGPGFVPFFLGIVMALLTVISFWIPDKRENKTAFWNNRRKGKNIFFIILGLVIYVLLINILGFYIESFLLMVYLMRLSGESEYKRIVLISIPTIVVVYIVFDKLLIIPFPRGILGI